MVENKTISKSVCLVGQNNVYFEWKLCAVYRNDRYAMIDKTEKFAIYRLYLFFFSYPTNYTGSGDCRLSLFRIGAQCQGYWNREP